MMDKDICDILQDELRADEQVLWAERTNHEGQQFHKESYRLSDGQTRQYKIFLSIILVLFISVEFFFQAPTPLFVIPVGYISLGIILFLAVSLFLNYLVRHRVYNVGAYALTNKRLFELDYDLKIIKHIDASRVKHVSGSEGVRLKPIGLRGNKSYQLGLMNNSTLTINYLHAKITQARNTNP